MHAIIVYWLNFNTTITFIPWMRTIWLLFYSNNSASIKHHPRMSTEFGTKKLLIIRFNHWISGIYVLIVIRPLVYNGSRMTAYEFLRNKVLRRNANGRFSLWYVIMFYWTPILEVTRRVTDGSVLLRFLMTNLRKCCGVKWQVMSLRDFWLGFCGLIYS